MSSTVISNNLRNLQDATQTRAKNISNAKAVGGFAVDPMFFSQDTAGASAGSVLVQRNDYLSKGAFVQTGVNSDLCIGGSTTTGLFVARTQDGKIAYTANGSARLGENKQLYLADGSQLMGWKLTDGKLPTNTSTTSSLTPLSLLGVSSKATATSNVGLVMNLKASHEALRGAGGIIDLTVGGAAKANSSTDIITPGTNGNATLHLGDQFILQAVPGGPNPTKFEYGGISVSKQISPATPMFGASTSGAQFTILGNGAALQPNQLAYNQAFSISVGGGSTYTFYANPSLGLGGQNYFNSLTSLASSIQQQTGLRAKVGNDDRLYISPSNANQSLTFADVNLPANGTSIVSTLGLSPTQAAPNNQPVQRFATMQELQQKMLSVQQGLEATINGVGITFGADSALSTLKLNASTPNKQPIFSAAAGRITAPTANPQSTTQIANAATIFSNNHGLKIGDYVRLENGPGNAIGAGTYRVNAVAPDAFEIGTQTPILAAALVGNPANPARGNLFANIAQDGTFTWQKIDGGDPVSTKLAKANLGGQYTYNVAAGGASCTFGNLALPVELQLAQNDVVYISGSAAIQDGYYVVTANPGGGNLQITTAAGAGHGNQDSDWKVAFNANANGNDNDALSIVKVAARAGNVAAGLDTLPIVAVAGSQNVVISVNTDNTVQKGDIIAFRNLEGGLNGDNTKVGLGLDNPGGNPQLSITKDSFYEVIDRTDTTITIKAELAPNGNVANVTASRTGFRNTQVAPGGALARAAGTILGPTAYIDYISKEYNALGVSVNVGNGTSAVTQNIISAPLPATYSATNSSKNFASGAVTENVINQSVTVIDSLGEQHTVTLAFGKTGKQQWNVEIYLPKNPDGSYDGFVNNQILANSGLLVSGQLTFDGAGQLIKVDNQLSGEISVNWSNKAATAPFKINWGAISGMLNGQPAAPGVTQIDSNAGVTSITNDGKVPGNLTGFKFDESGIMHATFDNGNTVPVAQVAIATFTNFNGLEIDGGYLYETPDSGAVLLKTAGSGGVGQILTGGVTASAVNDTNEYLEVIDTTQASAMAVNVASRVNSARDQLVNGLARG